MNVVIDLIPFLEFTQDDKRLYGGVLGAAVGAFIGVIFGGMVTLLFTIWNDKKSADTELLNRRLKEYKQSHSTLMTMRHELDLLLVANRQNELTLKRFSSGTYDQDQNAHTFYINVPKIYPRTTVDATTLLNSYTSTYWSQLK